MKAFFIVILGCCLTATALAADPIPGWADNWPAWRGPNANGTAPKADPPISWDDNTNIKWKAALPGRGSASPIVWGDRVFVVSALPSDRPVAAADLPKLDSRFETKTNAPMKYYKFVVLCFDRQTGKLRWERTATEQIPHEGHHPTHSYAAGSPTTDGSHLFVSFGSFGIYCYDFDGKLQWQRDLGRLNTRLGWGEAVTPAVHGDNLLLNWDQEDNSALFCLDARTGKTRWRVERDEKTSWNTPLIVEHGGRTQVIVNGTNRVRAYDLTTGKPLWQCAGMTTNAIPSTVSAGGVLYAMSGYKVSAVLAVSLDATGDVTDTDKVLWKYTRGTPYVPSPLLLGDRLWFTSTNEPILTTLDVKTGKPVMDRERLQGLSSFYASPVAAAGRVYFVDRDGTTLVVKQGDKLEVLATNKLNDAIDATPALVGKQLFLRGEEVFHLYCIEE